MNEIQVKRDLQELVNDFKSRHSYYKSLLESDIETKLIYDLFVKILGWDKNDFKQQGKVMRGEKRGRADYGFYIGDKLVFFLEVKRVGIPLDKEADKQVISYALSKRVPFAISTNFEQMKIFCVEEADEGKKIFRVFSKPEDYIEKFQDLLLLSKESFEQDKLLKEAIKEERLKKRMSIDKILLEDLMQVRKLIVDDIEKTYPQKYEINDREEIVQRIIDRLIFIRRCEDVGINPESFYLEEVKHLPDNKAHPKLKEIFEKYNQVYNSGLFAIGVDNDCDNIKIDGLIIKKLISYLYESKNKEYIYNFDWIDADVLGQVYEQYLGKILLQSKSGKSKLTDSQAHRKEQGIFYTPTPVVDYVVKNTLGELLKNKKIKPKDIKILDCACGSGSFLIKAFDYLYRELSNGKEASQMKFDGQGIYSLKTEILKNNLFGVDLDNKAVEITKLNLLLKASEKNRRLPEEVDLHIRHGNSLVDSDKIAPKDYFKWERDFQEGSFDIVMGNPPWGADILQDVDYFVSRYGVSKKNLNSFDLFVRKAISLLKEGGFFGFVIPKNSIKSNDYTNLRKYILENTLIKKLTLFGIFEGVTQEFIVLIFVKNNDKLDIKNKNKIVLNNKDIITQDKFYNNTNFIFNPEINELDDIFKKVEVGDNLGDKIFIKRGEEISKKGEVMMCYFCNNWFPASKQDKKDCPNCNRNLILSKCNKYELVSKEKDNNHTIPIITGEDITPFNININHYFDNTKKGISYKDKEMYLGSRLLMNKIASTFKVGFIDKESYFTQNVYVIKFLDRDNEKLKVLLALLNSRLWRFYYEKKFNLGAKITTAISLENMRNLHFPNIDKKLTEKIVKLVDNLIKLNDNLNNIGDKITSQSNEIKNRIKTIDEELNEEIYSFYNISKKDRDMINNIYS